MKTVKLLVWLGFLTSFLAVHRASAQTPPTLGLQLYAGVSITGIVGTVSANQTTINQESSQ